MPTALSNIKLKLVILHEAKALRWRQSVGTAFGGLNLCSHVETLR